MANVGQMNEESKSGLPIYKDKKIWIDMDNSPHVPFFSPIVRELRKIGYEVTLTARDCFQVCGLADLYNMKYSKIGRHYGKNKILKIFGTLFRAAQLLPHCLKKRPVLALSHGSRAMVVLSKILKIPCVVITDYEHVRSTNLLIPDWLMIPEVVSKNINKTNSWKIVTYPGIKEDVFINEFKPHSNIRKKFGFNEDDIVVTIRPPATEAHYHNPESDKLYENVINFLSEFPKVKMIILPRNKKKQTNIVKKKWSELIADRKIIIPSEVLNGLDLIWYSDLVISGGGSMNREAAALGVPAYSIFRGKIGAVDKYLSEIGRLVLIESIDDIRLKINIGRRDISEKYQKGNGYALKGILNNLIKILNNL